MAARKGTLLQDTLLETHVPWHPHQTEPVHAVSRFEITPAQERAIKERLIRLYGTGRAEACYDDLERLMRTHVASMREPIRAQDEAFKPADRFNENDIILITYGDIIRSPGKPPLRALSDFVNVFLRGAINTIHILPFFPSSSDRGYSIIDYDKVDPRLGTWKDIEELSDRFRLMFDGVFNHISSKSRWFQEFLRGNPEYQDDFITFSTEDAISKEHLRVIHRPRTSQLLTRFETINGPRFVWTTFSPDQVDLNYKNEKVLLRVVETLLKYVRRGADLIRLDAVAYLWTELGTSCAHLEQTHTLVQLFRAILDVVAPHVALITEANASHEENISYFGDGSNEAQMVYNFALPPLVLLTFLTGNCSRLSHWASRLDRVSDSATYLNILDSHDGVGLSAVKNILSEEEIEFLVEKAEEHGGIVSYKANGDGSRSPYELNITWYSSLNREEAAESPDLQVDRFAASRSIALALMGVPGIYLLSLFGSPNDREAAMNGGGSRSINRKTIDEPALIGHLMNPASSVFKIAKRFGNLIEQRIRIPAFHPNGPQRVLFGNDAVFSLVREAPDGSQLVLALTNVTAEDQPVRLSSEEVGWWCGVWRDILSERRLTLKEGMIHTSLRPYQVMWLTPGGKEMHR